MGELTPLIVPLIAFVSVVGIIFVVAHYLMQQAVISRRLAVPNSATQRQTEADRAASKLIEVLADKLNESKLGISGVLRSKLRKDLIRAGYFSNNALNYYLVFRLTILIVLPIVAFAFMEVFAGSMNQYMTIGLVAFITLIAFIGPDAYISHRHKVMQEEYKLNFPDLLDMLVVCSDAGLSLDAGLARVRSEIGKASPALAINLGILNSETRAGRSLTDALGTFADRLNLDEAKSLVAMLRQSIELGTDIGDALRVFSDEMRTRRLLRAEENANKLPVKMVLPLGLFIFPTILMVVMVPVVIKLMYVFHYVH